MSTVRIGITKGVEFTVDAHDNLSIERSNNWGVSQESLTIGFLTPHLIDSMIESLNRLRTFARG